MYMITLKTFIRYLRVYRNNSENIDENAAVS